METVRKAEIILGSGIKVQQQEEMEMATVARKSVHVAKEIKAGESISHENIALMRPGDGLSGIWFEHLLGKVALRDLTVGQKLQLNDVE